MRSAPHPRPRTRLPALSLLGAALLSSCTGVTPGRYPSLLPRAIEKRSDAEPVIDIPATAPDPALDAQIAAAAKAQATAASALAPVAARAEQAVAAARGAAAGSERWIDAQAALAELDGFRADASARLADLEQLAITRGTDGLPDYPALIAARDAAQAELTAQGARIERLQAGLAAS